MTLKPIRIDRIETSRGLVRFNNGVVFRPRLDETSQSLFAEHEALTIYASGLTREDLITNLEEDFKFLFREYVDVDPATLSEDAIALRTRIKQL